MIFKKCAFLIIVFILVLIPTVLPAASEDRGSEKLVTADFRDTDVQAAIRILFEDTGLNYTLSPEVKGKVTLRLEKVPFQDALSQLLNAADLCVGIEDGVYIISPNAVPSDRKRLPAPHTRIPKDFFPSDLGPIVRVGLISSLGSPRSVAISSTEDFEIADSNGLVAAVIPANSETTFRPKGSGIEVSVPEYAPVEIRGVAKAVPLRYGDVFSVISPSAKYKRYLGTLEFRGKTALTVIDELPLEDYVCGVIPVEVNAGFRLQAKKALAIAIRTYALRHLQTSRHAASGFDLCDSTDCQGFAGAYEKSSWAQKLARDTAGQIITYEGKPIYATYCTDCGGVTQSNEDAGFGRDSWPYLRPVADNPSGIIEQPLTEVTEHTPNTGTKCQDYCAASPFHSWSRKYTAEELDRIFSKSPNTRVGTFISMEFSQFDSSERVKTVLIKGESGEVQISGSRLRNLLGPATIRSTLLKLTITPEGDYVIEGKGYGHGVGLCAWGADGLAKSEKEITYEDILKHYYTGVEIRGEYGRSAISRPQETPEDRSSGIILVSRVSSMLNRRSTNQKARSHLDNAVAARL